MVINYNVFKNNQLIGYLIYSKNSSIRLDYIPIEFSHNYNILNPEGSYVELFAGNTQYYYNTIPEELSSILPNRFYKYNKGYMSTLNSFPVFIKDYGNKREYFNRGILVKEEYASENYYIESISIDINDTATYIPYNLDKFSTKSNKMKELYLKSESKDGLRTIEYLNSKYDLSHHKDCNFVIVKSEEEADYWLEQLNTWNGNLRCIDIETTGVEVTMMGDDYLTLVTIGYDEKTSVQFPFRQAKFSYNLPISYLAKIYKAVRDMKPEIKMLAFYGIMEINGFKKEGYPELRIDVDVYVLNKLVDPVRKRGYFTLSASAKRELGLDTVELEDIFVDKIDYSLMTEELAIAYGATDCTIPISLFKKFMPRIEERGMDIFNLENKLIYVKANNIYFGLPLNLKKVETYLSRLKHNAEVIEKDIREHYYITKSLRSSKVLSNLLYTQLKLPILDYTSKGEPSTSKDTIKMLRKHQCNKVDKDSGVGSGSGGGDISLPISQFYPAAEFSRRSPLRGLSIETGEEIDLFEFKETERYPVLSQLHQLSAINKEISNLERWKKNHRKGRCNVYIDSLGTVSGRQAGDCQQSSKLMKACIETTDNYFIADADYSQVELRMLAFISHCKKLVDRCSEKDVDIHRVIASLVTNVPIHLITDEVRKKFKSINFGIVYMMSSYGLASTLFDVQVPSKEQVQEAADSIEAVFSMLPEIRMALKNNKEQLLNFKEIYTIFGRKREIPELKQANISKATINSLLRSGNNTSTQGSSADLMKYAELRIYNYIKAKGWDKLVYNETYNMETPLVMQLVSVHDEVLIEYHKSIDVREILTMIKECMEIDLGSGAPPFFTSTSIVKSWGETDTTKAEIPTTIRDAVLEDSSLPISSFTWEHDVKRYRQSLISTYINGLISKYGDNAYKYVNHPVYSTMLLDNYLSKEDSKKYENQIDRYRCALESYKINNYQNKDKEEVIIDMVEYDNETEEETTSSEELMELTSNSHTIKTGDIFTFIDALYINYNAFNMKKVYEILYKYIQMSKYPQMNIIVSNGSKLIKLDEKLEAIYINTIIREIKEQAGIGNRL